MKTTLAFLLTTLAALSTQTAHAADWRKVLDCDGGAAVVDNISVIGRGGAGLGAQLVIRDARIVQYFKQNTNYGEFVDGQWIGKSYYENSYGRPDEVLVSFSSQGIVVKAEGQTLTVTTGGANWTFRNCSRN